MMGSSAAAGRVALSACCLGACRFGFVTFDKKDDAAKALAMCNSELFLIGDSATPVIVELARVAVRPMFLHYCMCND